MAEQKSSRAIAGVVFAVVLLGAIGFIVRHVSQDGANDSTRESIDRAMVRMPALLKQINEESTNVSDTEFMRTLSQTILDAYEFGEIELAKDLEKVPASIGRGDIPDARGKLADARRMWNARKQRQSMQ